MSCFLAQMVVSAAQRTDITSAVCRQYRHRQTDRRNAKFKVLIKGK